MKIDWKAKETRIAVTAFVTVAAIIIFARFIDDIDDLLGIMKNLLDGASTVLMPFVMGAIICYILLPIVRFFDSKVFRFFKGKGLRRGLSVLVTYVLLLAGVAWLFAYLIPILITNVQDFINNLPGYVDAGERIYYRLQEEIPILGMATVEKAVADMVDSATTFTKTSVAKLVMEVPSYIKKLTATVTDSFVAIITSIYLLVDIERIKVSAKRLIRSVFKEKQADTIYLFVDDADRIFGQYIRARVLTSVLVFILTFIGFTAYGVPYATLFALVAGITNVIPFYGPIIGFLIIVPLTLLISPDKAIFAGVFTIVLQQLEGYIIDPMVMGDSVDMRPFWVLMAVTVGGVFGLAGMVIAVPVFAILGRYINDKTEARLNAKKASETENGADSIKQSQSIDDLDYYYDERPYGEGEQSENVALSERFGEDIEQEDTSDSNSEVDGQ